MVVFLAWLLFVTGIVYGLNEASLLAWFRIGLSRGRPLVAQLIYCRKCLAFWVGISVSCLWSPLGIAPAGIQPFLYGFIAVGWMRIVDRYLGEIESIIEYRLLIEDKENSE